MFEPKSYVEQRLVIVEAILNQLLAISVRKAQPDSEESQMLYKLMSNWEFHGHSSKANEATRILGGPFQLTEDTADRQWIARMLRCNFGVLEVYGEGEYNNDPRLPGNDAAKYSEWLALLESPTAVVRDTRPSEFFKDTLTDFSGMPVLKIITKDDKGRSMLHIMLLFHGLTVQSLSLDHLPANWDWDAQPDSWRVEVFTYLNNMSKRNFLLELGRAIDVSRGHFFENERGMLFVPEDDAQAVSIARDVARELSIGYKAITLSKVADASEPSVQELLGQFGAGVATTEGDEDAPTDQPLIPLMNFRPEDLVVAGAFVPELQMPVEVEGVKLMGRPFPADFQFNLFHVSFAEELLDKGLVDPTDVIDEASLGLRAIVFLLPDKQYETLVLTDAEAEYHFVDEQVSAEGRASGKRVARFQNGQERLVVTIDLYRGTVESITDSMTMRQIVGFWLEGRRINNSRLYNPSPVLPESEADTNTA